MANTPEPIASARDSGRQQPKSVTAKSKSTIAPGARRETRWLAQTSNASSSAANSTAASVVNKSVKLKTGTLAQGILGIASLLVHSLEAHESCIPRPLLASHKPF